MKKKKLNARIAKYVVALSEFRYTIEHRPGEKLPHVDVLSRADILVVSAPIVAKIRAVQQEDDRGKALMAALQQHDSVEGFTTSNGILYEGEGESRRLYVPESMETEIIRSAHEQGHFGVRKTKERIKVDYYISGLEDKIKRCIATCVPCIVGEKKRGKPEGELCPIPKGDVPLDTLHVDHLGPIPSTRKSYGYILTVIDAFTKFVWLFPTKSTGAEEAVKKLRVITDTFGNPRRIICDRGAAFTSGFFTKFCDEEGIELHTIVTGVPRGNGQIERVHRIAIPMITKLSVESPKELFKHVIVVQKCLNNSWQRAINMTPFELLTGVKMRTKEDAILHAVEGGPRQLHRRTERTASGGTGEHPEDAGGKPEVLQPTQEAVRGVQGWRFGGYPEDAVRSWSEGEATILRTVRDHRCFAKQSVRGEEAGRRS